MPSILSLLMQVFEAPTSSSVPSAKPASLFSTSSSNLPCGAGLISSSYDTSGHKGVGFDYSWLLVYLWHTCFAARSCVPRTAPRQYACAQCVMGGGHSKARAEERTVGLTDPLSKERRASCTHLSMKRFEAHLK